MVSPFISKLYITPPDVGGVAMVLVEEDILVVLLRGRGTSVGLSSSCERLSLVLSPTLNLFHVGIEGGILVSNG